MNTKTYGIYLRFRADQSLKYHGIGRLLSFLLSGTQQEKNIKFVLAVPAWYIDTIQELIAEQLIDQSNLEILPSNKKEPLFITFLSYLKKKLDSPKTSLGENTYTNRKSSLLKSIKDSCFTFLKKTLHQIYKIFKPVIFIVYNRAINNWSNKFIAQINQRKDIDCWFVPTIFWEEVVNIKKKLCVAVPDLVYLDHPEEFPSAYCTEVHRIATKITQRADSLICYSRHVKESHLVKELHVNPKKVKVIKHANVEQTPFLLSSSFSKKTTIIIDLAKFILNDYLINKYAMNDKASDLYNQKYLFYSSQVRPYKNFLNLIKAFEQVLKAIPELLLVTTGDIYQHPNLSKYIEDNHLTNKIISIPHVPGQVLAALNALATVAVNPTLFEGGFPFTFSEAYSVGSPSVMSAIPNTLDEIRDDQLREKMLFDPLNPTDMANKISWAIANRDELYDLQSALYQQFAKRNWLTVAQEYIAVFEETSCLV